MSVPDSRPGTVSCCGAPRNMLIPNGLQGVVFELSLEEK